MRVNGFPPADSKSSYSLISRYVCVSAGPSTEARVGDTVENKPHLVLDLMELRLE